jgi:hypothetical protein
MVWVYTGLLSLVAVVCLAGAIKGSRPQIRVMLGVCCILALVALAGAYVTGFTFHLNRDAPVSTNSLVYMIPGCSCVHDQNLQTVRVRDG